MLNEEELEDLGWRWPSACPTTLASELEKRLHSPPPTARQFLRVKPGLWRAEGPAPEESWISVAAMHPCGGKTGFPSSFGPSYWLNLVCEGHGVVRELVSQFLQAAGCSDLAGQVLLEWQHVEQDRLSDTWTSRTGMVPNGLTLDVDLTKKRRGRVTPGELTIHFGGRLVVAEGATIEVIPPLAGLEPTLRSIGLGISLSLSNVVWVGLLGSASEDGLVDKETVLELTEANLLVDHSLAAELLQAAGQERLAELVIENATRERDHETPFSQTLKSSQDPADSSTEAEDVVLSVDDLVKSVLELGTANFAALSEYLSERVSLLRLELGAVDGELTGFNSLFNESLFNGLCGDPFPDQEVLYVPGVEVPGWLGEPTYEMHDRIGDLRNRASQLRYEVASLRQDWLRAVLIQAEPALEHRRTTERRLQQRGLGPRPRPPARPTEWDELDDW